MRAHRSRTINRKMRKPGCNTTANIPDRDGPYIMPMGPVCFCNRVADNMNPGSCDAICPTVASFPKKCECKDPGKAGVLCDEDACKLAGEVYCKSSSYTWRSCAENVNRGRMKDIPFCPCQHGRVANGRCHCDRYYSGAFCNEYTPPGLASPTSTPRSKSIGSNIGLPIGIIFILILFIITCVRICRRCRRCCLSYDSGSSLQIPVAGPPISESTVPMHQPPYGGFAQPYPPALQPYPPAPAPTAYTEPRQSTNLEAYSTTFAVSASGGSDGYQRSSARLVTDRHASEEREPLDQPSVSYGETAKQKD